MYNEELNVEVCVSVIDEILDTICTRNAILAINDGSNDKTLSCLYSLIGKYKRLEIINHPKNLGYGGAIKSAYRYGVENRYDYVIFMDADLTQDPNNIRDFFPYMEESIDIIKASRYIEGSHVLGVPEKRKVISMIGNFIARFAFHLPITDYTNGFRAIKIDTAKHFYLESTRFPVLIEEMWQAKYYARSYREISYTLRSRFNEKDSKFSYDIRTYTGYLKYCIYALLGICPPSNTNR